MNFKVLTVVNLFLISLLAASCGGNSAQVTMPDTDGSGSVSQSVESENGGSALLGYYEIYVDAEAMTAVADLNRSAMLTLNITGLLNITPAGLSFDFHGVTPGPGFIDIDLDMIVTHPVTGNPGFNVYDFIGILTWNRSDVLDYNPKLNIPVLGLDQELLNPDGYTRWFNPTEFTVEGLFGYIPGNFAPQDYTATATLNPYKYYADGLLPSGDLWSFLTSTIDNGVFSSGSSVARNHVIRFPDSVGIKYGYAFVANWDGVLPENHPANTREAVGFNLDVTDDITFTEPGIFEGSLIFDVSIFDWTSELNLGAMEDYIIKVESTVLGGVYIATAQEMTPVESGTNFHKFHFEIPADNVMGPDGNEFWVIVEYPGFDYTNPLGIENFAGADPLAAFTRAPINILEPPSSFDVSMSSGFMFDPKDITVPVGEAITWTNDSSFPHTVTADPLNPVAGGPVSDDLFPLGLNSGEQYSWTVPDLPSGTVWYYHCRIHATPGDGTSYGTGMTGSITIE